MPFLICVAAALTGRIALEHHNTTTFAICGVICVAAGMRMCRRWIKGDAK